MSLLHVCHVSWLTDKFILVMVICMFSWYFTQLLRPSLPHLVPLYCGQTVFNPRGPLKLCRKRVRDKNTSITRIIQVKRCAARDLLSLNYPAIRLNTLFRKKAFVILDKNIAVSCLLYIEIRWDSFKDHLYRWISPNQNENQASRLWIQSKNIKTCFPIQY